MYNMCKIFRVNISYCLKFSCLQASKKIVDILNLTIPQKEMFSGKLRRSKICLVIEGDQ